MELLEDELQTAILGQEEDIVIVQELIPTEIAQVELVLAPTEVVPETKPEYALEVATQPLEEVEEVAPDLDLLEAILQVEADLLVSAGLLADLHLEVLLAGLLEDLEEEVLEEEVDNNL